MDAALDTAQLILPGLTALGGAYYGARWQAGREADAELRVLVDDAIRTLQNVTRGIVGARSHFIQEGVKTSPAGYTALGELEEKVADAQEVRDRLVVRTEQGSALPVYFLNAMLAIGRANDALRTAAVWPEHDAHMFDLKETWDKLQAGVDDFYGERAAFLKAAQSRVAPRAGVLRRVLHRVRRTERTEGDSTEHG